MVYYIQRHFQSNMKLWHPPTALRASYFGVRIPEQPYVAAYKLNEVKARARELGFTSLEVADKVSHRTIKFRTITL